jgi:hypothetical protein
MASQNGVAAEIALGEMQAHVHAFERTVACLFDRESVRHCKQVLARLQQNAES